MTIEDMELICHFLDLIKFIIKNIKLLINI